MDFEQFVTEQADVIFEDIKDKLGDRWDELRDEYEDLVKTTSKYLAEYVYKSKRGDAVDPHLLTLQAIVQDFVSIGSIEAQSVLDVIVDTVKDYAKDFASLLFKAAADAGLEALKDLDVDFGF